MRFAAPLVLAFILGTGGLTKAERLQSGAAQAAVLDYEFTGAAGLLFFHVRPEMADAFEAVTARVSDVLAASDDPVRRQQAEHWKVFRSTEDHDSRIYVLLFDPVVSGADYDPVKILAEAVPDEVPDLYRQLQAAIVRIERMGLAPVR